MPIQEKIIWNPRDKAIWDRAAKKSFITPEGIACLEMHGQRSVADRTAKVSLNARITLQFPGYF